MVEKKYVLLSLEDDKARKLADVLGNKTCKKIIDYLAEDVSEASEKDLADALKVPINTIEYNLKKLLQSGLLEKSKKFFWSKRGKKIDMYKLSNKSIIISPKNSRVSSKLKSILPVALLTGVAAVVLRNFLVLKERSFDAASSAQSFAADEIAKVSSDIAPYAGEVASRGTQIVVDGNFFFSEPSASAFWFVGGAVFALVLFAILNWRKF